jgi:hypothetical protein
VLSLVPVGITEARAWIERHHAHHHAPPGGRFAVGVARDGDLCCVALVSRPVARLLDARGDVAEITRCASDGTPHAASMAVAAATRMAIAGGYRRVVSYTLLGEAGTSYRAAGWHVTGLIDASDGWLSRAGRSAVQTGAKVRWESGPGASPADGAAALVCGWCAGRIALTPRPETLPLLALPDRS